MNTRRNGVIKSPTAGSLDVGGCAAKGAARRGIPARCRKGGPGAHSGRPLLGRLSPPILLCPPHTFTKDTDGATREPESRGVERGTWPRGQCPTERPNTLARGGGVRGRGEVSDGRARRQKNYGGSGLTAPSRAANVPWSHSSRTISETRGRSIVPLHLPLRRATAAPTCALPASGPHRWI